MNINWQSDESHIFINPRMPYHEINKLNDCIKEYALEGHILLATSGSTAIDSTDIKWVALKKSAFLASAQSVNKHLDCSHKDVFLNTLPHFHVGGLALFARAELCGARMANLYHENYKWNPKNFVSALIENKVTISSLVPTQVFDLVHNQLCAPPSLRAIVVGGGFLNEGLYTRAKQLNWPLLPSYGMTECCSQIATAMPNFNWHQGYPELTILPHMQISIATDDRIELAGESLLTGYIFQSQNKTEFVDPKINEKIVTSDVGELKENKLIIYGRSDENVKINGENVSLIRLQSILLQTYPAYDCAIVALPDQRQGQKIAAVFNNSQKTHADKIQSLIPRFNEQVFPFERITQLYFLDEIPKTELGKIKRNLIMNWIMERPFEQD